MMLNLLSSRFNNVKQILTEEFLYPSLFPSFVWRKTENPEFVQRSEDYILYAKLRKHLLSTAKESQEIDIESHNKCRRKLKK